MKVKVSDFPHQPGTLPCCRECDELSNKDCIPKPLSCVDFCIANHEFVQMMLKEAEKYQNKF